MSDISGGALKFTNRDELWAWLKTQPREVSIVIAARAALRVAPFVGLAAKRLEPQQFAELTFATYWASALARVASKYPTRANELPAANAAAAARDVAAAAGFVGFAGFAANAAANAAATGANANANAAANAAFAAAAAAAAYAAVWEAVSADANLLNAKAISPSDDPARNLASAKLWLDRAPPAWAHENWRALQLALKEPHWRLWRDWYQRRIDGREDREEIELLFATLPIDPRDKDPAEQNKKLAAAIERLRKNEPISTSDVSGGELKFTNREDLEAWLKTQPRDASLVIAARAALRVLPILPELASNIGEPHISMVAFVGFWGAALARFVGKYRSHDAEFLEIATRYQNARVGKNSTVTNAVGIIGGSAHAYLAAHAVDDAAEDAKAVASVARTDHWIAVSSDANRLKSVPPIRLASESLWLLPEPNWAQDGWRDLQERLSEPHWRPWLDWYQRRLDGGEDSKDIERLFAKLPIDPREKDPAEQNEELIGAIEATKLLKLRETPSWDFFISYSTEDEAEAREIAAVLETAGHSTFAQFKDFAPGNNFVREMQRGLDGMGRMIALYSEEYQASDHCQAEWAAAYNLDPSGRKRKLIPFLLRPTALSRLAQQVIYKSLVGLTGEARRSAILDTVAIKEPLTAQSVEVAKQKLAETASPQPSLNEHQQLDAGPNKIYDKPYVDQNLVELPYVQRTTISAIKENLPSNTPPVVRSCLQKYDDELRIRGSQPIVGVLRVFASAINREVYAEGSVLHGPGLTNLFESFFKNDSLLSTHFPLKNEEHFADIEIDEDRATGSDLFEPVKDVAKKVEAVKEAGQATEELERIVANSARFAADIAPLPPELVEPGSRRVSLKRRYVLGTLGFLVALYNLAGSTASIYATPEGAALLQSVSKAIDNLTSLLR